MDGTAVEGQLHALSVEVTGVEARAAGFALDRRQGRR